MASHQSSSPPRPRQVVQIGVTGHRPHRLAPAVADDLPRQCEQVFAAIAALAERAHDPLLHAPEPPLLRIISPIAEGADRIVAQAGLSWGADLQCPLPFDADEYSKDFESEGSREEFYALLARASAVFEADGRRDAADAAYENAGRMVIEQSDFLIAIWDGKPAAGRGGTTQIVDEAIAQNVPVIWLHAAQAAEPCLLVADEECERKQHPLESLSEILASRFTQITGEDEESALLSHTYCAETQPRLDAGRIFRIFRDLIAKGTFKRTSWRVKDFEPAARGQWEQEIPPVPKLPESTRSYLLDKLCRHYAWADGLSINYAGLLRSSSMGTSLLSACAVLVPMLGYLLRTSFHMDERYNRVPPSVEFGLIVIILWITFHGQRKRWHERWLNYRQLAELLRQYCFLSPLGCPLPTPRPPAHVASDPHRSWVDGMFRTIARDIGLAPGRANIVYLTAMGTYIDTVVEGQIIYHDSTHKIMHRLSHRVHLIGTSLFVVTLLACITHVFMGKGAEWLEPWLEVLAVVPPAFGAAFYGITIQGEFARSADRSLAMSEELKSLRDDDLKEAREAVSEGSAALRRAAQRIAGTMIAETMDWSFVFRYRKLNLPG
jgi:hypothetical protein